MSTAAPPLDAELALEPMGERRFRRVIDPRWSYADRVFGGYTSALALAAAREASVHPTALAVHVMFLAGPVPGPVEIEVSGLREGRSASALRATLSQDTRPVLTCDAWFGERLEPGPAADGDTAPPPDTCPSMAWLTDAYPFLGAFEERAIDYPASEDDFRAGPPSIELWARPGRPLGTDPFFRQAFDLMLIDAHLLDAVLRPLGITEVLSFSLDLSVWFRDASPDNGWRRMRATAPPPGGGFSSCTATLWTEDGRVRASGGQQGRLLPMA